jgi:phosphatidylserine decarboxylase
MSADLDLLLSKVKDLSVEELRTLQATITQELSYKTGPVSNGRAAASPQPNRYLQIPGAIRRTREEIEALLATIFSAEELAAIGKTDFSKLPIGAKSLSEMINEDREDRF